VQIIQIAAETAVQTSAQKQDKSERAASFDELDLGNWEKS